MSGKPKLPQVAKIKRYLKDFDFFDRYVHGQDEGDLYVETHATRFYETLSLLKDLPGITNVLELGAVPYYLTILMIRYLGLGVEPVSFFEFEQAEATQHEVGNRSTGEVFSFAYEALNVERDLLPYENASFDAVLCCEILEHLLINPSHMLSEVHRVVRPGGYLLLTTPNVLRWENLLSLHAGRNIYDRYHGNGIYGRHNREYSPTEVRELLHANGFAIEYLRTRNVYGRHSLNRIPLLSNRGDTIFALAKSAAVTRSAYPESLYVLMDEYKNVIRPSIKMGENDIGQIGRGWHEFEPDGPGFRWTGKKAEFFLKNSHAQKIGMQLRCHHPDVAINSLAFVIRVNGQELTTVEIDNHAWHDVVFDLGNHSDEPVLRFELEVSRVWVPQSVPGSVDRRELGLGVSRIWLD
jgi:SAM-dependent methyltransferase